MAPASNVVAIRGAVLLVLLVGVLVSTAEAARNPGLGAASVAAGPAASVHPSSFLGCMVGCGMQLTRCEVSCPTKPLLQWPECAIACAEVHAQCMLGCTAPAPPPPAALGPEAPQA